MTFYVGQKVVCVDDKPRGLDRKWLAFNGVYTVVAVERFEHPEGRRYVGMHLAEIDRPASQWGVVVPWNVNRFRPAVQPKTDISIFERILDRAVSGEPVDA